MSLLLLYRPRSPARMKSGGTIIRPTTQPRTVAVAGRHATATKAPATAAAAAATARTTTTVVVRPSRRSTLARLLRHAPQTIRPPQPLGTTRTTSRTVQTSRATPRTPRRTPILVQPSFRETFTRKTTKAILVRVSRRPHLLRRQPRLPTFEQPNQPTGTTRTQARQTIRTTRRPTTIRALTRSLVITRPSRTGLPASAYTRTVTTILVHAQAVKTKALARTRADQPRIVKPALRGTGTAPPTDKTVKPIVVRMSRRSGTIRSLERGKNRQPLSQPRKPLSTTRTTPRTIIRTTDRSLLVRALQRGLARTHKPSFKETFTRKTVRPIVVRPSRRAHTVRDLRARTLLRLARPPKQQSTTRTVPRTNVNPQTGRATTARARWRTTQIGRSLNGIAGSLAIIVTGRFRPGRPAPGDDAGTPGTANFDAMSANRREAGTPGGTFYDPGTPGGGAE